MIIYVTRWKLYNHYISNYIARYIAFDGAKSNNSIDDQIP